MRIKTPSTSSSCTNNTFATNELFILELHKQEPLLYSNKIVGFKPLPLIGVNAWSKYNCRSPTENPPRRILLRIE